MLLRDLERDHLRRSSISGSSHFLQFSPPARSSRFLCGSGTISNKRLHTSAPDFCVNFFDPTKSSGITQQQSVFLCSFGFSSNMRDQAHTSSGNLFKAYRHYYITHFLGHLPFLWHGCHCCVTPGIKQYHFLLGFEYFAKNLFSREVRSALSQFPTDNISRSLPFVRFYFYCMICSPKRRNLSKSSTLQKGKDFTLLVFKCFLKVF